MQTDLAKLDIRYLSHAALSLPGGGELYYEEHGDGPPVVLINNFYIVSPIWQNFTGTLAQRNRLISYDLRNQGASQPGPEPVRFADHADDVRALLDHLGIEKAYVLGTSISTLIARDFTLAHPDRVAGLILVGPAFSPNGSLRRELISRSWLATLVNGGTKALFDHLYPLVFTDQVIHEGGTAAYLALRDNFLSLLSVSSIRENLEASLDIDDSPERLAGITCPTQIIVGDGDFAWSASVLDDALARLPDSRGVTLSRAGHVPFFDDPDGFQQAVQKFIDECEERS
jgi:3-oxoadipate enol-lactonase